ncbi:MAG: hypothetical protein ACREJC_02775, partial [Tepidisphaeraceae bacterium]
VSVWVDLFALLFTPALSVFALACLSPQRLSQSTRWSWVGAGLGGLAVGLLIFVLSRGSAGFTGGETRFGVAQIGANARLLCRECLPWSLGYKFLISEQHSRNPALASWSEPVHTLQCIGGLSLLAGMVVSAALLAMRSLPAAVRRLGLFGSILAISTILGFLVSTKPKDVLAVRYLGPLFWAAPAALAPLAWRIGTKGLSICLAPYLVVAAIAGWVALAPAVDGLRPVRHARGIAADEFALIDYLRKHDLRYGAADYWLAYRLTFLAGENPVIVPLEPLTDRYSPYRFLYQSEPRVVLIFHPSAPRAPFAEVEKGFHQLGAPIEIAHVAGFDLIIVDRRLPRKLPAP